MSIKCPICGNIYIHDRKICQVCENKFSSNELITKDGNSVQKWNCSIFLEFDNLAFGKHTTCNRYIKISSEPKFSDFKAKSERSWNCDSNQKSSGSYILRSGISKWRNYRDLPISASRNFKKEVNNTMIYE